MPLSLSVRLLSATLCAGILAGCDGGTPQTASSRDFVNREYESNDIVTREDSVFDLFRNSDDPNVTIAVNRYIWTAAQEVLNFMPIEAADPFSGVIAYGYGRPPGGAQAYRGTVYVQDPALDARSLNVALSTQAGPVSAETTRAIEDAILTRARQLRIGENAL